LLARLPRVVLLLLKTNDCLRAVDNALVWDHSELPLMYCLSNGLPKMLVGEENAKEWYNVWVLCLLIIGKKGLEGVKSSK